MTSRQAHDDTRWGLSSVVGPAGTQDQAVYSQPIPESSDLPERLDAAIKALVDPAGCVVSFTVAPEPESVTEARHFTLDRLDAWNMGMLSDDVGLVVSELVTNALRHGGHITEGFGLLSDPMRSAPSTIRLRLMHQAPWLLCGIMDASPAAPRRKEPDYIAETGRGLHLVESFCTRWGWRGLPGGKVVWALFRTP